jgi:hypothetical protein
MGLGSRPPDRAAVPRFERGLFRSRESITRIGDGELGGKAGGLLLVRDLLAAEPAAASFSGVEVFVPRMVVLATDVFDAFLERNGLGSTTASDSGDDRMTQAFLRAELPVEIVGDLRALVEETRSCSGRSPAFTGRR